MFDDNDLLQEFLTESQEHLDGVQDALLQLETQQTEQGQVDSLNIDAVFRSIHSIKGGAGFLGLDTLQHLTHNMENVLGKIRGGLLPASPEIISVQLQGIDLVEGLVAAGGEDPSLPVQDCVDRLLLILDPDAAPDAPEGTDQQRFTGEHGSDILITGEVAAHYQDRPKGHNHLYKLTYTLKQLEGCGASPIQLLEELASFGTVIDSRLALPEQELTDDSELDTTVHFSVVYATMFDATLIGDCTTPGPEAFETLVEAEDRGAANPVKDQNSGPSTPDPEPEPEPNTENPSPSEQPEQKTESPDTPATPAVTQPAAVASQPQVAKTVEAPSAIRVATDLLDKLIGLTGELVLVRNSQIRALEDPDGLVGEGIVKQLDQVTSELQEVALALRMQPVANVLTKVPRMVRDLSSKLDKQINAVITGKDTEIDRSILEQLGDPLTHFIRNACDHGLETPEERKAAGKAATGELRIHACHEEGQVVISISDDGRGMNPNKLRSAAVQKGVIDQTTADAMSDLEALYLIMAAGFSTAAELSAVSGRGVGMDVVRQAIENIGGSIEISSELGRGSTFILRLPLTLAIMPALIVHQHGLPYAIPQVNLEELVCIQADDELQVEYAGHQAVYRLRKQLLPLVFLDALLGYERDPNADKVNIAVLRLHGERFGLVIDQIATTEEVVVKPLHERLPRQPIFSGSSILGDGGIALILDIDGIYHQARPSIANQTDLDVEEESQREDMAQLLFRAGAKEQLALPLPLISRVVRVPASSLEVVGGKDVVRIDDELIRVLRLERHLPLKVDGELPEDVFIILPRHFRKPIGILASQIIDSAITPGLTQCDAFNVPGVTATAQINEATTLMLDYYHLVELDEPSWFKDKVNEVDIDENKIENLHALLVEDTPFFQRMVESYLKDLGLQVYVASDGVQALEILNKHHVDLVVSDIEMPNMNGLELAEAIRADDNIRHLPLLALSSRNKEEEIDEALKIGFDAYETKIDRERLLVALHALMTKAKQ